jgi:hypothetical protein
LTPDRFRFSGAVGNECSQEAIFEFGFSTFD